MAPAASEFTPGTVEAVHVAPIETFELPDGAAHTSAIRKQTQAGPVRVERLGFAGDEQHDPGHGGPNRAVHVFASEAYAVFEARAGRKIPRPVVGENLTVSGCADDVAHVGDVIRVGGATLQVTMPTERCSFPGRTAGLPKLLKWMIEDLRTGYYLRVLEPGEIGPGDAWSLEERGEAAWSIDALSAAMYRRVSETALVEELEGIELIAPEWKARLRKHHDRHRQVG